ncbi:hypothetical protein FOA52_009673 [Chlamydomonas sp. UWO 241]|nr:hypothetical protein FOA52_009673 [Chlamydomonas sp. UWO 241]
MAILHAKLIALCSVAAFAFVTGYFIGFVAKDLVVTSEIEDSLHATLGKALHDGINPLLPKGKRWPGDTIHCILPSDGGAYQNLQSRILYASYNLVRQMPGGEKMTGFTRILHRTVPDLLMEEIPTYQVWDIWHTECDHGCSFPVVNRPQAVMQFMRAAGKDPSLLKGAWLLMIEADYVFMQPVRPPGNAHDPSASGEQYLFDYIMPQHPDAAPHIQKLYGPGNDINEVPASGPAPVILRHEEWLVIGTDYERLSTEMESDAAIVKQLAWVREMYTWDVAIAMHPEIKIRTLKPPNSTLMCQPPFDIALNNASFTHYTWGALYYEGLQSQGGKNIYKWDKREFMGVEQVLKPTNVPMPPEFREGLSLTFDQLLTRERHELVVAELTQLNKAIDTLPDLHEHAKTVQATIDAYEATKTQRIAAKLRSQMRYTKWPEVHVVA